MVGNKYTITIPHSDREKSHVCFFGAEVGVGKWKVEVELEESLHLPLPLQRVCIPATNKL